jgi:hypothetical protein
MEKDRFPVSETTVLFGTEQLRDVKNTEIPLMNKQSLISDKISNIVMPDLIRHPEYSDLDSGFRRNDGKAVF